VERNEILLAVVAEHLYESKGQVEKREKIDYLLLRFIGFCYQFISHSKAQNFQDVFAGFFNDFKKDGFFVEFGATDGVMGSNTFLLEKEFEWKGILAEPNKVWHDALGKNISCSISHDCVYHTTGMELDFLCAGKSDLSTIDGYGTTDEFSVDRRKDFTITKVKSVSLYDLLERYKAPVVIDYLSLDTEGSELAILEAFFDDNKKYTVRCVTVEHNCVDEVRKKFFDLFTKNGYKHVLSQVSRWDDFYVYDPR